MFMGMAPFGALLAGALADGLGAPAALAVISMRVVHPN
jgi:hypothetical protein